MRARYLVANAAWVVVFGDDIVPIGDRRFFDTRKDLKTWLASHGFELNRSNRIVAGVSA